VLCGRPALRVEAELQIRLSWRAFVACGLQRLTVCGSRNATLFGGSVSGTILARCGP